MPGAHLAQWRDLLFCLSSGSRREIAECPFLARSQREKACPEPAEGWGSSRHKIYFTSFFPSTNVN